MRSLYKSISSVLVIILLLLPSIVYAKNNSFVTIVNPIRGSEFWDQKNQNPIDAVKSEMDIVNSEQAVATWLVRFDALSDQNIISLLKKNPKHEVGIFLEVTPTLTASAGVTYHKSNSWHDPESVFLTGYSPEDRYKIIDHTFAKFKEVFGYYPKAVGAWWIDANSLNYMNIKYGVTAALITSDQRSTDNYTVWGQYWGAPYYPFNRNALLPAQQISNKIPLVIIQWAARDPFNAYGKAVEESTYSVQTNDYIDFHNLDINYFNKLTDIYTKTDNKISQLTIGLENSYNWNKYKAEYANQIKNVAIRATEGKLTILTMSEFAGEYKKLFPEVSPTMVYSAQDPLNPNNKVIWFMNPYYRAGLFFDKNGIRFRDIREYSPSEEPCLQKICNRANFINSIANGVDDITSGKSFYVDEGIDKNLKVTSEDTKTIVKYTNSDGKERTIEFLPRDISIDGTNYTISGLILKTQQEYYERKPKDDNNVSNGNIFTEFQKLLESIKNMIFNQGKYRIN